ncbi:MAG: DMT family transporter [Deltaproteobacteria bacterium]|jgi:drug/metabolite transporter (DMT)-like permease|nr:DMT family transporter [Deltaproteobacteria bacterium]
MNFPRTPSVAPGAARFSSSPELRGFLLALAATFIWSLNFIIGRGIAETVPPISLSFLRWFIAFLSLLPFTLPAMLRQRRHFLEHWGYYALTGLVGVSMVNTFIYIAAHSVAALNMSLIAAASPLFVLILARIFYQEDLSPRRLAGIAAVLAGVCLLITRGDPGVLTRLEFHRGDLFMLCGALSFALYTLLARRQPAEVGQFTALTVIFGLGVLFLVPLTVWEVSRTPPIIFSWPVLGVLLYLGLGTSILAFWLWGKAIALIGPARTATVYYSLPLFCGIEAILFLGEAVIWIHFASGVLILGGLLVATRK